MKKIVVFSVIAVLLLSVVPSMSLAVPITIESSKLDSMVKVQAKEMAKGFKPEDVEEWADLGPKLAGVIKEICSELSIGVNEFITTPAGAITVALIAWKIVGEDLWGIIGGIGAWFIIIPIILWSYRYFHMSKREVFKEDKKKVRVEYNERHDFDSRDAKTTSAVAHAVAFFLVTFICMYIIF